MSTSIADAVASRDKAGSDPNSLAGRVGFWVAILTAVLAATMFVIGIMTPPRSGPLAQPGAVIPYPYTDVASFIPGDYIWLYPGILLAPAFVVLMACIHSYAPAGRKVFTRVGLSFAVIYATIIVINYFIQLAVVQPSILSGEMDGLSLFTQYNPHGVFIALEALAYPLMSAALLFAAGGFVGGRLERTVRWVFVASPALAVPAAAACFLLGYDIVAFEVTILTINWIVLIASGVLLSILFRSMPNWRTEGGRND